MFLKTTKTEKDRLSRYRDPFGEISTGELRWGEWYLRHKLWLRQVLITVLVVWSILTVGYGLSYLVYYFSYGYFVDQKNTQDLIYGFTNYQNLQPAYSALPLQFKGVEIYNSLGQTYDFVVPTFNPNKQWLARVSYRFKYLGGETPLAQTVFLPGSLRPLVFFGHDPESYPTAAQLVIEKVEWRRIDPHVISDPATFIDERLRFTFENFNFIRANRSTGVVNHRIEFDLFNDSAYSYKEAPFYIELLAGGQTVGIVYIVEDAFKVKEVRHISFQSLVPQLDVDDIRVWPALNPFDSQNYIEVGKAL
ncbi:MAG TPA: hypothetical protein VJB37_02210 [Patescibacteria group bacterium]|nr:hypothetical protein [Patescibacteria group bacterium]